MQRGAVSATPQSVLFSPVRERRGGRSASAPSRLFVDFSPLRRYPAYRDLWLGFLVNTLGSQLTLVGVPYQVFRSTHSSLQVGLVSLAQLGGLLAGSLLGGVVADHFDRRRLLVLSQVLLSLTSLGLALNAASGGALGVIYLCSTAAAALSGVSSPTRSALVVHLVEREDIVRANALWQLLFQITVVVGPSLAGVLLGSFGLAALYAIDAVSYFATVVTALRLPRVEMEPGQGGGLSLRSFTEGMSYLRGQRVLQAVYLVDLNAMVFGMPRALFPALALDRYHGGASVLGLLYAAPGFGALLIALFTGWAARVRRQGVAVVLAVTVWGLAITAFGAIPLLAVGLVCLAIAGAADVVSAIFRGTILQVEAPDELRGRVQGVQFAVVAGGPRLGDVEAALVAGALGLEASVVSGGIACLAGVVVLASRMRSFWRYETALAAGDTGVGRSGAGESPLTLAERPALALDEAGGPLTPGSEDSVGG